jgi:hypothetical protein
MRPPQSHNLIIRHGVRVEPASALDQPQVLVATESVLTVRWRTVRRADLQILFSTTHRDGRFGGNYQMQLAAPPPGADSTAWQETRVRLSDCKPTLQDDLKTSALQLRLLVLSTAFAADGLEIAAVRVSDSGAR